MHRTPHNSHVFRPVNDSRNNSGGPGSGTPSATPAIVRRKCREIEQVAHKLKEQLREKTCENDDYLDQIHYLKKGATEKDKKIEALNQTIAKLRSEIYESVDKETHETVMADLVKARKKIEDLEFSERMLTKMQKDHEENLQSLYKEVSDLQEQLASFEDMKSKFDEACTERHLLIEECKKLNDKLVKSEQLRKEEVDLVMTTYGEKIAVLQEQLQSRLEISIDGGDGLCQTFTVAEGENENAPESLAFLPEIKCQELEQEINHLTQGFEEEKHALRKELEEQTARVRVIEQENISLKNQVEEKMAAFRGIEEEKKLLEKQLAEKKTSSQSFEKEKESLEKKIHESEEERKLVEMQLEVHITKVKDLEGHITSSKKELDQLTTIIDSIKKEKADLEKQLSVFEEDHKFLNKQLTDKTTMIEDFWEKIIEAEGTNNREKSENESLRQRTVELAQELGVQRETISELEQQRNSLNLEVQQQQLFISELQGELKKVNDQLLYQSDLSVKLQGKEEEISQLQKFLIEKDDEVKMVESKMSNILDQSRILEEERRTLVKQLEDTTDMIQVIQEEKTSLEKQMVEKDKMIDSLLQKLDQKVQARSEVAERLQEEITGLRRTCQEVHMKEIQRLNDDLKRFNDLVSKKDEQMVRMQQDLDIMEQSFTMERLQKQRYQKESMQLEAQLDALRKAGPTTSTTTNNYFMPTVNINTGGNDVSHTAENVVKALTDSYDGNRRRGLPGSAFFIADEPTEVMNATTVSGKNMSDVFSGEDPMERLQVLQRRNAMQPPAQKCSYTAEMSLLNADEMTVKGIQTKTTTMKDALNQTVTVTETTTKQVVTTKGSGAAPGGAKKIFSPGSRSVFRRAIQAKGSYSPQLGPGKGRKSDVAY